ncbi:RsmF rRNA methyltransferase first C-terminal domain-containing protein [Heliorestis convoluta]|uniref:SAM-dependent methyltransferase n=1 Tax=Heliorestis convoluta TaxID=356322 RepID=A0A5Q2N1A2_9FIRM|nr:RsmF rRNA methyltransferase first C-terminal domain-containing protein [Heliorestis convoluta]QGG47072.1 SAM-dependent methyltransferase [Heliorestis convoluta]
MPEIDPLLQGDHLYAWPAKLPRNITESLKILRPGWHLGTIKRDRFEPSHALALALQAEECQKTINLSSASQEVYRYLKGESLTIPANHQGWHLITLEHHPLGWGKAVQGQLKNHYPKGLRWL